MRSAQLLLQQRQPMIRFLGKRTPPKKVDHTPTVHPASAADSLPSSFASYRQKAQQHGPLGGQQRVSSTPTWSTKSQPGASLGPVEPVKGEYFDRDELPPRFRRTKFSIEEMDAIDSGGASMHA